MDAIKTIGDAFTAIHSTFDQKVRDEIALNICYTLRGHGQRYFQVRDLFAKHGLDIEEFLLDKEPV